MPCTTRRRYWEDTLILETEHESETGIVRVIDFMPMRDRLAASGAASR
jgi:hypothetical protein